MLDRKINRVVLVNAPGCSVWRERVWVTDLSEHGSGRRVRLENMPMGAMSSTPDPKCPKFGDEILVTYKDGDFQYDLQNGTILKRAKT